MSCEQVPRTSDDPYIFTETPISTPVYNTQLGRLTPIKVNQQQQQNNIQHLSNQQHQIHRVNGNLSSLVNGNNHQIIISTGITSTSTTPTTSSYGKGIATIIKKPNSVLSLQTPPPLLSTLSSSQQQQTNYLKLPPPLYHNNIITTTTITGSGSSITPSSSSPSSSSLSPTTTTTTNKQIIFIDNNSKFINHSIGNNHNNVIQKTVINRNNNLLQQQQQITQNHIQKLKQSTLNDNNLIIGGQQLQQQLLTTSTLSPPINSTKVKCNLKTSTLMSTQQSQQQQQQQQQQLQPPITTSTTTDDIIINNINNFNTTNINNKIFSVPKNVILKKITTTQQHTSSIVGSNSSNQNNLINNSNNSTTTATTSIRSIKQNNNINNSSHILQQQHPLLQQLHLKEEDNLENEEEEGEEFENSKINNNNELLQRISSSSVIKNENFKINNNKISNEWHSPETFIFDYVAPGASKFETYDELTGFTQNCWFSELSDPSTQLNRDQRLELKRSHLRRQAMQHYNAQKLRKNASSKRRILWIAKVLNKLIPKDETPPIQRCCIPSCTNDSLALTAYCYLHITHNTDQRLFYPCTAKFSDNSQCRVPVFDISHELPLCREHAWKRDNYNRMLQEQKPKKPPRKKPKPSAMTRPPKRNKKKKKLPPKPAQLQHQQPQSQPQIQLQQQQQQHQVQQQSLLEQQEEQPSLSPLIFHNHHNTIQSDIIQLSPILSSHHQQHHQHQQHQLQNQHQHHHQHQLQNQHLNSYHQQQVMVSGGVIGNTNELLNVCENSSAYESSEDTGVGGLSESELIGSHDVIEEIPLGDTRLLEEHDLTNVLNQIPEDAFNELFTVEQNSPFEPTQEEQEDLERALEAVDEQVKSLEQLTGTNFLGDFLDVDDQMLDDTDICSDVLQTSNGTSEIRGLVHT